MVSFQLSTTHDESLCAPPSTPALLRPSADSRSPHRSLHSLFNVTRIRHVTRYHKSISPCWRYGLRSLESGACAVQRVDLRSVRRKRNRRGGADAFLRR